MLAQKHVISRWQKGICLEVFGVGVGSSDNANCAPEAVKADRLVKIVAEEEAWDVQMLLSVKRLPRN